MDIRMELLNMNGHHTKGKAYKTTFLNTSQKAAKLLLGTEFLKNAKGYFKRSHTGKHTSKGERKTHQ